MAKKKKNNYVNNAELYRVMKDYIADYKEAEAAGKELPRVPNYVGECIMEIAKRLSYKPNFINYRYREDMVSDGIENVIRYIHNFDPNKTQNPFAYFTQIIYYAYLRRIQKEKKQLYIKHKVIENSVLTGTAVENSNHSNHGDAAYIDLNTDYMNDFVEKYEKNLNKKPKKKVGLEKLIEDEDAPSDN